MARVSNTLIGPSSGRVGNAVFSTWKGINVLKEKPISVANPNSDGQQMRRSAMAQIVDWFRNIPSAVRVGFKKLAVQKSEWNAFASYNLKNGFDYSTPPTATIVPADILISKGTIASTPIDDTDTSVGGGQLGIYWLNPSLEPGQSLSDLAIAVVFNATKNDFSVSVGNADRGDLSDTWTMPATWQPNDVCHFYLGFYNPLSGESSDSVHQQDNLSA